MDVGTLRWGQSGPELITRAVEQCALQRHIQAPEVFCPVHFPDWELALDPSFALPNGPETRAIHLWNEMWRRAGKNKNERYHPECLYERLKRRYLENPVQ